MAGYQGRAKIVAADGSREVDVIVHYTVTQRDLESWRGLAYPDGGTDLSVLWGIDDAVLQLPDGRQGQILMTNLSLSSGAGGTSAHLDFAGNGPAPS